VYDCFVVCLDLFDIVVVWVFFVEWEVLFECYLDIFGVLLWMEVYYKVEVYFDCVDFVVVCWVIELVWVM